MSADLALTLGAQVAFVQASQFVLRRAYRYEAQRLFHYYFVTDVVVLVDLSSRFKSLQVLQLRPSSPLKHR